MKAVCLGGLGSELESFFTFLIRRSKPPGYGDVVLVQRSGSAQVPVPKGNDRVPSDSGTHFIVSRSRTSDRDRDRPPTDPSLLEFCVCSDHGFCTFPGDNQNHCRGSQGCERKLQLTQGYGIWEL